MKQATLCLLIRNEEILLVSKKRGFGVGLLNVPGGKREEKESIEEANAREVYEEVGIKLIKAKKVAELDFIFPDNKSWDIQVVVFISEKWSGEPNESEEVIPIFYKINDIPYEQMWPDHRLWMPQVILGKLIRGSFSLGNDNSVVDHSTHEVTKMRV